MLETFASPFMQRAFLGGFLVACLSSYYGPFLVQRRMAFMGDGLAHAAFAGVALGLLLGIQPLWLAAPYAALVAVAIVRIGRRKDIGVDTVIGVFFSVSMALGIILLKQRDTFGSDAFAYLFGDILYVGWSDILATAIVLAASLATLPLWKRWAYATFDRSLALADRLPVQRDDYIFAAAVAVAIVVSIKVVGIVLIAAFLVLPPATARLVSSTFLRMAVLSWCIAVVTVIAGLWISDLADLPSGAVIILCQAACFVVAAVLSRKR